MEENRGERRKEGGEEREERKKGEREGGRGVHSEPTETNKSV